MPLSNQSDSAKSELIDTKNRVELGGVIHGADWYRAYCASYPENELAEALTDAEINRMVKELR